MSTRSVWVVNDTQTCIPGTRTLWHDLAEWLDAEWVGDASYPLLAWRVEQRAKASELPSVIIRNATWFGPIDLKVPTISLIQDIMPEHSYQRREQIRVAHQSTLTVFNSAYTKSKYPELANITSRVIPLSVDFDLFAPRPAKPIADICWVGAPTYIKGWDLLGDIIRDLPTRTFALILKEHSTGRVPDNVQVFTRVPHADLVNLINGCQIGLCTSREETQHLAGIEMGMCGLPMVAPPIGCYMDLVFPGRVVRDSYVEEIGLALSSVKAAQSTGLTASIAEFWKARFSRDACKAAWKEAVEWVTVSQRSV